MKETWKDIPGFEGAYQASDHGCVRSLDRSWTQISKHGTPHRHAVKGRVLRPGRMQGGHMSVVLGRDAGSRCVHELVLLTFIGPPPPKHEARHKNGVPGDNRLLNLQWATRGDNGRDKKWHKGCSRYKLSPADIRIIKTGLKKGISAKSIAERFDIHVTNVYFIKNGDIHADVHV